uniref:Uncharacterized protein n=1 Tax=Tetranychus urticae TaxID=32264 RepID=T1KD91_TETUR
MMKRTIKAMKIPRVCSETGRFAN